MCIRDRSGVSGGGVTYGYELGGRLYGALQAEVAHFVSCVCLLYTSDAADDLLCVDLGGRRIIKTTKYKRISV